MLRSNIEDALKLIRHDMAYCHCRRHYLPDIETRRNRLLRLCILWGCAAAVAGWLSYHFVLWASQVPGAMRVSL